VKIEGNYPFPGANQLVWDLLTDPEALEHCTPGCKQLKKVGDDEYEATLDSYG
jgi:carbon monoxide dehydrogenase subunit G